jgi:hypothetical protein
MIANDEKENEPKPLMEIYGAKKITIRELWSKKVYEIEPKSLIEIYGAKYHIDPKSFNVTEVNLSSVIIGITGSIGSIEFLSAAIFCIGWKFVPVNI